LEVALEDAEALAASDEEDLEGLEEAMSGVEVLLFKQAIAQGWDCPRAAVLLIYRELKQEQFSVQTVGRILRMPEQHHYERDELNYGYVYTNLSQNMIRIVAEDADYFSENIAKRRAVYADVALELTADHVNSRLERNRLGAKYYRALEMTAQAYFGFVKDFTDAPAGADRAESPFERNIRALQAKMIRTDVSNIEVNVAANLEFDADDAYSKGGVEVDARHKVRFARMTPELEQAFWRFCAQQCGSYAKAESIPVMAADVKRLLLRYCNVDDVAAMKIVLEMNNSLHFAELLAQSLEQHAKLQEEAASKRQQRVEAFTWDVPKERFYSNTAYSAQEGITQHILEPFYEAQDASRPERDFVRFLEEQRPYVAWWYKNGDSGREHFSVSYTDTNGVRRLFFADFILMLKSGCLCVLDTKTRDSDPLAPAKHNALLNWAIKRTTEGTTTIGSVILPHGSGETPVWKYSTTSIENTSDISTWRTLIFSEL
jgi:type III restriction enzyme